MSWDDEIDRFVSMIDEFYPNLDIDTKLKSLKTCVNKAEYRKSQREKIAKLASKTSVEKLHNLDYSIFFSKSHSDNMEFVKFVDIQDYIELDRECETKSGYTNNREVITLAKNLKDKGYYGAPLLLMVNKQTGRGYIHDGNHRIAAFNQLGVQWVPLNIQYCGLYDNGRELFSRSYLEFMQKNLGLKTHYQVILALRSYHTETCYQTISCKYY